MMEKILSIEHLIELVASVKNLRKGFITNYYLDTFKHAIWISNDDFRYVYINETLFLIKESNNFCNLFYCSASLDNLSTSIKLLEDKYPKLIKVIDVVGSKIQCKPIVETLMQIGYTQYQVLVRMSMTTQMGIHEIKNEHISFATIEDAVDVHDLLLTYFDAKCEQIPYKEELAELAKNNKIIVFKEDKEIISFVIFNLTNATNYLRYWFVHPNHRDKKIGSMMLNRFFYEGKNTKRQLLWVITNNDNAIKRYHHYGFQEEFFFDYTMLNNLNTNK